MKPDSCSLITDDLFMARVFIYFWPRLNCVVHNINVWCNIILVILYTIMFNIYVITLWLLASLCNFMSNIEIIFTVTLFAVYRESVYGMVVLVHWGVKVKVDCTLSCWYLLWKSMFEINCRLKYSYSPKRYTTKSRNQKVAYLQLTRWHQRCWKVMDLWN